MHMLFKYSNKEILKDLTINFIKDGGDLDFHEKIILTRQSFYF